MKRTWRTYLLLFVSTVLCDRLIKWWVMSAGYHGFELSSWFAFTQSLNRGISFSLLSFHSNYYYVVVSLVVSLLWLVLLHYAYRRWRDGYDIVAETVVLAGAFSNLVDRVWYGGVVDYIEISYGGWTWPAFNLADMLIVVGLLVMCIKGYYEE
ncbi:MAG: signal peptidase II [Candidatus Babeliales bacterium]